MIDLKYHAFVIAGIMLTYSPSVVLPNEFGDLRGKVIAEGSVPEKYRSAGILETPTGGGVKAVAVYLQSPIEKSYSSFPPAEQSRMRVELANGAISPVLAIARVGGRIEVVNREADTVLMKLTGLALSEASFIQPNDRLRVTVNAPEVSPAITVYEVHGRHRQAWVIAPSTPYAAITDEKGNFAIRHLPEGNHTMTVWSPYVKFTRVLKRSRIDVTVMAGQTTELLPIVVNEEDFE